MDIKTKELLKISISQYKDFSEEKKKLARETVQQQLRMHEMALELVGSGFCEWQIEGAKIFLRIFKD